MNTDEYVPSEARVRLDYQDCYPRLPAETTRAEFDRFLARVRRAAAREALDGLAREAMGAFKTPQPPPYPRSWAEMAGTVEWYRDTHYPEETP